MVLVLQEMQLALFRIWTHITMSIFYNDNHYTMDMTKVNIHPHKYIYICVCVCVCVCVHIVII